MFGKSHYVWNAYLFGYSPHNVLRLLTETAILHIEHWGRTLNGLRPSCYGFNRAMLFKGNI